MRCPVRWLRADETVDTVLDVDLDSLMVQGKRAILFDLDNTLEPGRPTVLRQTTRAFLDGVLARGFRIGVLSNRRGLTLESQQALRVEGVAMLFHAGKPRKTGYFRLLRGLDVPVDEAVFVGDRRLTDVLGACRVGLTSIRVRRPMP